MADITAARLYNLDASIALILGVGSGTSGYGQTVSSSQVNNTQVVDADHINNIYTDMVKARIHQVGVTETGIREVIEDLNTIAEETSQQVNNTGTTATDAEGTKKGIADYESLMTQIEGDKFVVHTSQAALEPKLTSTRTSTWNGLIYHIFTITFTDADHRRHFFNAGGEVRLSGNNTGATGNKGLDWAELLQQIGVITFKSSTTSASGSGQGYAIGDSNLTSAYQTVFSKVGTGSYSNIYAGNLYTVKARETNDKTIEFRIELNDVVADGNIDNNVDGALSSTIQQYRAIGASSVTVPTPTYFTTTSLDGFNTPVDNLTQVFVFSANPANTVNEGQSVTYNLTTTNVDEGSTIPYTISGISIADLVNASLTGNFIVNNNTANLTIQIKADSLTEGNQQMTLSLDNGKASITHTVIDSSAADVGYYYDPQWYNEFQNSYLNNVTKSTAVSIGRQIGSLLYRGAGQYTNAANQTRYALFRRPGAAGPAYWTQQWVHSFRQDGSVHDANITADSGWPQFTKVFFSSADQSTNPPGFTVNGVALSGAENTDAVRSTQSSKAFINGDGVGDFGNRGTTQQAQDPPATPSATFAFTVTPSAGMNFNNPFSQGEVTFNYTITCTAGSGSVTIQETSRPSLIPVGVDDSYSSGWPNQSGSVATKTYAFTTGSSRQVQLKIHPGAVGTWDGTFAFLESTGSGQLIQRGWGGTFTSG